MPSVNTANMDSEEYAVIGTFLASLTYLYNNVRWCDRCDTPKVLGNGVKRT